MQLLLPAAALRGTAHNNCSGHTLRSSLSHKLRQQLRMMTHLLQGRIATLAFVAGQPVRQVSEDHARPNPFLQNSLSNPEHTFHLQIPRRKPRATLLHDFHTSRKLVSWDCPQACGLSTSIHVLLQDSFFTTNFAMQNKRVERGKKQSMAAVTTSSWQRLNVNVSIPVETVGMPVSIAKWGFLLLWHIT